jgi:hypothetical protein
MMPAERSIIEAAIVGYQHRRDEIVAKIAEIEDALRGRGGEAGEPRRRGRPPMFKAGDVDALLNARQAIERVRLVPDAPKRTFSQETRAKMARAQRKRYRLARVQKAAAAA